MERTKTDEKLLLNSGITTTKELVVSDVVHRRTVFFVKPYFWIIRDDMESARGANYEQIWHYRDGSLREREGGAWTTEFSDANLWLVPAAGTDGGEVEATSFRGVEEPMRGWHCPYYDMKEPAPELRFRRSARGDATFQPSPTPTRGVPTRRCPHLRHVTTATRCAWGRCPGG